MALDLPARALAAGRRKAARRAGSRRGRGVVLLYHRLGDPVQDPWRMTVSPERFEQQMALLASELRPLALGELVVARGRELPPGAVAVSFDDGYADNLSEALPVLERYGVPATVFVATGYVGDGRRFWWDELRERARDAEDLDRLQAEFRVMPPEEVGSSLNRLRARAGVHDSPAEGERRPLDRGELGRLFDSELIEIGAHTRNHPSLAHMPAEIVRGEVEGSRSDLAEWLGSPPALFSYPFGMHGPRARRATRAVGFEAAFGTYPAPVTWLSDRFELGRLWVEDVGAEDLEERLRGLGLDV